VRWATGSLTTRDAESLAQETRGADVVYYEVAGGGHAYPGRERLPAAIQAVTGGKNRDIDGPTGIWAFFARFLCAP